MNGVSVDALKNKKKKVTLLVVEKPLSKLSYMINMVHFQFINIRTNKNRNILLNIEHSYN